MKTTIKIIVLLVLLLIAWYLFWWKDYFADRSHSQNNKSIDISQEKSIITEDIQGGAVPISNEQATEENIQQNTAQIYSVDETENSWSSSSAE